MDVLRGWGVDTRIQSITKSLTHILRQRVAFVWINPGKSKEVSLPTSFFTQCPTGAGDLATTLPPSSSLIRVQGEL